MSLQRLRFSQLIPTTLDEAWRFFSSPQNLKEITPPDMGFDITSADLPEEMFAGMIIAYRVRPLWGIPTSWVTEITHVQEGSYFVDEQRLGPYAMWNHMHTFTERADGILMVDTIHYALPLGPVGNLLNRLLIRRRIETIFHYRSKRIEELFGTVKSPPHRDAQTPPGRS